MDTILILNSKGETYTIKDNTSYSNCMGYAFNKNAWLVPILDEEYLWDVAYDIAESKGDEYEVACIFDSLRVQMEEDISSVLKITSQEEIDDIYCKIAEEADLSTPAAAAIITARILSYFPNVRLINSVEELKSEEDLIVFGGRRGDFHFVKSSNYIISHKRGEFPPETISQIEDGFSWTSKRVYFAAEKGGETE